MNIFGELQRRNVFRVGIAYIVASWVLLQVVDVVQPILELPDWAPRLVLLMLAIGLVPVLVFSWAFELTPDGIKKESEVDRSESITGHTGKKLNYVIVGSLVLALGLLLVERQATKPDTGVVATTGDETLSIAVLPFVNMSSDPEQEHFSDGITEEILNSLASVKELKVAGRTSSFAFKGQSDDLRRIGDSLGVEHILEGSVRKSGDTVRITAQLIHVDDGFHLWSETYDRKLDDVFAIQDEIADEILGQLRVALLNEDAAVVAATRTDPLVYELYLRARQRIYTRDRNEIAIAIEELDQAIDIDPEYAPAYAQRGIASMLLSNTQYGDVPVEEANRVGKRYVDLALDLNPELAEGWAALGLYENRDGLSDTEAAIGALTRALELNPNNIDASNWLQIALRDVGDALGAKEILEELVERDPLYRPAFSNAITIFSAFGEQDKAQRLIDRIASFNPDNPDILHARARLYNLSGRVGECALLMEELLASGKMHGPGYFTLYLCQTGTAQWKRAAETGSIYFRDQPFYEIGRKEEALELAREQALAGFPQSYFYLLLRENREEDLIAYFEEHWPNIQAFAREVSGNEFSWGAMNRLGVAYKRVSNQERLNEITLLIERWQDEMKGQGVDNFVFVVEEAALHALLDETDAAIAKLEEAADRGLFFSGPIVLQDQSFESIADDPRLLEIQEQMRGMLNEQRAILDLPPVDENFQPIDAESI